MTISRLDAARRSVEQRMNEDGLERHVFPSTAEVRTNEDGTWTFDGEASVFDSLSQDLGGGFGSFKEMVKRGAYKDALKTSDVRALINHNPDLLFARNTSGTLKLSETPKALRSVVPEMPDVSYVRDLRVLLDRRDISQMSFGFSMGEDGEQEWYEDKDGNITRIIHRVGELFDVSVVTFPAYTQTSATARSLCGVELFDGDTLDPERVRGLAWKVHRGEIVATMDERRQIDALLELQSTVSPWTAERTLLAVASEPELLAAVPGKRAHIELQDAADAVAFRRAAAARRLRARAHLVR